MKIQSLRNIFKKKVQTQKLPKLRDDDIFLVSYPKSGNTWIRFVLGNYYSYPTIPDFSNLHLIMPDIHYNPQDIRKVKTKPVFVKSHFPYTHEYKKVVYIVRDPRDVAVSYYFHCQKFNIIKTGTVFPDFIELMLNEKLDKFGSWQNHVLSWVNTKKEDILFLKYEEILMDPFTNFTNLLLFSSVQVDNSRLKWALHNTTFPKLRELENANQSSQKIIDILKNSNKGINFMREGKTGGYKKYFTPEIEERFLEKIHKSAILFNYI